MRTKTNLVCNPQGTAAGMSARFLRPIAVCLSLQCLTAQTAVAQSENKKVVEQKSVQTADGWRVFFTYYKSTAGRDAPVVVLLHGKGGNRLLWGTDEKPGFAQRLQDLGYAVVAVDLRKHGESQPVAGNGPEKGGGDAVKPNDYILMVTQDLEAVKEFIFEEHQAQTLNMRKLAIVAADTIAPVALNFAANDWLKKPWPDAPSLAARTPRGQDVRGLVLLSPEANAFRVQSAAAINRLKNPALGVASFVVVGTQDKFDKGDADRVHQQMIGAPKNEERMYFKSYDVPLRGTDLLGKKLGVEELMLAFFDKHLKKLPDPWVDRKNRLQN